MHAEMTTGEADAYRAGYAAACDEAVRRLREMAERMRALVAADKPGSVGTGAVLSNAATVESAADMVERMEPSR